MAATKVQANWSGVAFNNTAITRVTNVSISQGGSLEMFSGDTDIFPVVACNLMNNPSASVTTADAGTVMGIAPGSSGSFTATHKDAKGQTSGDILYVIATAVAENTDTSGAHGGFGTATTTFKAISADGSTNPLSFTRA